MTRQSNEGKVCDAVVRFLELRSGSTRTALSSPDRDRVEPPVDLFVTIGDVDFAIEHTRIESFVHQIETDAQLQVLAWPVLDELDGAMPKPGYYDLIFPMNSSVGRIPLVEARQALKRWILEAAGHLRARSPTRLSREAAPRGVRHEICGVPDGFPFSLTLVREVHWDDRSEDDGVLMHARMAPDRVARSRQLRISAALEKKGPKLRAAQDLGRRAVLVLEDNDISLSSHLSVAKALAPCLVYAPFIPDETFLVEAKIPSRWRVWQWRHNECG